jgi:hypothetical protein
MSLVVFVIALAPAINGLLAGLNVDMGLVRIPCAPAHRCSGVYDLCVWQRFGHGLFLYPLLGRGAALLTVLATAFAFVLTERKSVCVV